MRWAEKRQRWAWRQLRLVHAVTTAALAADPGSVNPEPILDQLTEIATLSGDEGEMERQLETLGLDVGRRLGGAR